MLDEKTFNQLTVQVYNQVYQAFENIDPDDAEADFNLDNISVLFRDGKRFVVNRQPPTRQIWLATDKKGLHFNYDMQKQQWICDKNGSEFFEYLNECVSAKLGYPFNAFKNSGF